MRIVAKTFTVEEGTQTDMTYKIQVFYGSKLVDTFHMPTMHAAQLALKNAGYQDMGHV